MPRIDGDAKSAAISRLRALQAQGAPISEIVRFAAQSFEVSERTVWRWIRTGPPGQPGPVAWELSDEAWRALYVAGGRPTVARRLLVEQGTDVPSVATFARAVAQQVSKVELAYMRRGEDGRRRYSVYRRWEPAERNEVWEADHALLDVLVRVPRWRDPVRPWLTILVDGFSRLVMGWVLSIQPTAAEVLTAIREGIVVDASRGPWGGVPDLIRFDGGKEFLAEAVRGAVARLGFDGLPTPPYSPHKKGKVERMHRTIGDGFVAQLPHYLHASRTASGDLYAQPEQLTIHQLQDGLRAYIDDYNTGHRHRSLGGLTPAQKWETSCRALELIPAAELRWMMLADSARKVNKDGIHFQGVTFIAPELAGRGGDRIEVRYMPHDLRTIEVFANSAWVCTAYPQDSLSNDLAIEFSARQRQLNREMGARRAAAAKDRSRRLAPITADGEIEELPKRHRGKRLAPELSDARVDALLKIRGLGEALNTALSPDEPGRSDA